MMYLSQLHYIHRDLAARNILLDSNFAAKIADFGLSKEVDDNSEYYRANMNAVVPIRWTAIEALEDNRFTTKSDVWSFGVLALEIFSDGATPYEGM